ncbi:hypothetical protein HNY73_022057 [Argiope bruennichi]|uniref:Uncharacterized protein n=1 Tax=Argiope bruennichi TaxID=94029 RepID=A0A8T0DZH3_ARGBR|nr:hypothetical protein HNY73_022057 [Argiope bruennichi]
MPAIISLYNSASTSTFLLNGHGATEIFSKTDKGRLVENRLSQTAGGSDPYPHCLEMMDEVQFNDGLWIETISRYDSMHFASTNFLFFIKSGHERLPNRVAPLLPKEEHTNFTKHVETYSLIDTVEPINFSEVIVNDE